MLHPVVIQKDSHVETKDKKENVDNRMDNNKIRLVAVVEFIKKAKKDHTTGINKPQGVFNEEDEEIADSYSAWGEVALHYSDLCYRIGRQKNLSGFLLDVVKYE